METKRETKRETTMKKKSRATPKPLGDNMFEGALAEVKAIRNGTSTAHKVHLPKKVLADEQSLEENLDEKDD
jgi:hypothetical protein